MDGNFANDGPERPEDPAPFPLSPIEAELVAMRSVLADVVRVVETIAPGVLDRHLAVSRIRLQELVQGRMAEAFDVEQLVLKYRVDIYERSLGRTATQS